MFIVLPEEWKEVQTALWTITLLPSLAVNIIENSVPGGSTSLWICEMWIIAFFVGNVGTRGSDRKDKKARQVPGFD
jgi:hypothetical protein